MVSGGAVNASGLRGGGGGGPHRAPHEVRTISRARFDVWGEGREDWSHASSFGNAASLTRSNGGFMLGGGMSRRAASWAGIWRFGHAGGERDGHAAGYTDDRIAMSQRLSSATFKSVLPGRLARGEDRERVRMARGAGGST